MELEGSTVQLHWKAGQAFVTVVQDKMNFFPLYFSVVILLSIILGPFVQTFQDFSSYIPLLFLIVFPL
jgi:hypothetical protein